MIRKATQSPLRRLLTNEGQTEEITMTATVIHTVRAGNYPVNAVVLPGFRTSVLVVRRTITLWLEEQRHDRMRPRKSLLVFMCVCADLLNKP